MKNQKFSAWVVLIVLNLMNFVQVVEAATITLATAPLANATTTVVRPNILYVLDNSGSMQWDYLPDYVSSGTGGTGSEICWEDNKDTNDRKTCAKVGGSDSNSGTSGYDVAVPFATSDINYAYYNPNTYYQPPIKADGTSYTAANPFDADTDGFTNAGSTNLVTATTIASITGTRTNASTNVTGLASSVGLVGSFVTGTGIPANAYVVNAPTATSITLSAAATATGSSSLTFKTGDYKHQVFCNTSSPTTQQKLDNTICKETSDSTTDSNLLFPSATFNRVNSYDGAPYYYTMSPMQYCTTSTYTSCQPSADATYTIPALYRWCQTYTPGSPPSYSNCQDLRNATHTIPDYLGGQMATAIVAVQANASLTVSSYTPGLSITGLTINGVTAFAPTFTPIVAGVTSGANSATGIAQLICAAVHANRISSGYECPTNPATSTLVIKATIPSAGVHASYTVPNGYVIQVNGPATDTTVGTIASGTLQISSVAGATRVDDITVGGTSILAAADKPQLFADGTLTTSVATTLVGRINANTGSSGYTATNAGNVITITAVAEGINTSAIALTGSKVSATGTINVGTTGQTTNTPASLGGISVSTTSIVGALTSTNLPNGTATTTNAETIRAAVGNGYTATRVNSVVTVTAPVATGNTLNGISFTFTAGTAVPPVAAVTAVNPTGLITFGGGNTGNSAQINDTLTPGSNSVKVGSTNVNANDIALGNNRTPTQVAASVVASIGTGGTVKAYVGGNAITPTCDPLPATVVCLVDTSTFTNGSAVAVGTRSNFGTMTTATTATAGGVVGAAANPGVTNFAPALSTGSAFSGGRNAQTATGSNMGSAGAGAYDQGTIATNATAIPSTLILTGGVDPVSAGRVNVGKFKRVDIVPSVNSYPATGTKDSGRIDCAGTACTYAEERQNFANWYSYYRTRMLMMKSSSTLAFDQLDSKYRVGFDLLSHYQNKTVDLEVAQFVDSGGEVTNQRSNWWNNLVNASGSSGTPLRSSLLKAGKYYAGKLTTSAAVPATPEVLARAYIDIKSSTSNGATISSVTLEGVQILGSTFTVSGCTGSGGSCSSSQRTTVASNLASAIAARIALGAPSYTGPAYAISSTSYTSGGSTVGRVVITAPVGTGQSSNGDDLALTSGGTINATAIDMSGGADAKAAIPATVVEPIQYSCQQNYTLLVTDGYWNSDGHDDLTLLSGTGEIGNQDNVNTGLAGRPSYDGAMSSTTCVDGSFSSCGTLADIAMYYYKTDLRSASLGNTMSSASGLDVSENNVFKSPSDSNQNQHMTLFTMALGAPGTLRYRNDYPDATSGDYYDIATTNPVPASQKNWPAVKENDPTTIDDLWHAAVNGRGKYFSARDPNSVVSGLVEALSGVQVREGSAAAAATSNLEPVAGDNFAYVATYTTQEWSGDLQARYIDLTSGAVSEPLNTEPNECVSDDGCAWSAKKKLDNTSWSARNIYVAPSTPTPGSVLRGFTYGNLSGAEQAYFDPSTLNQYGSVFATNPTDITAAKMVNFLRGDISLEVGNLGSNPEVWRNREHVLGDIVSTQPIFVSAPRSSYQDAGYATFVTAQAGREGAVYVSSNDGMLHAFASDDFADASADGGDELWAYIPTQQLPHLKDLADTNYTHHYYLDGQITVADVNFGGDSSDWHTILVGGMGGGGTAYYALDITDPVNPKYLWEFTATNLGYTYGNATINKLPNGEWAVLFSSGYNNANGVGYLYAVNPQTGTVKTGFPISTGTGTAASPSNFGKVAAWVDNSRLDNTATHIYGGDMDGNLWRFDLTTKTAFKLAHLQDAEGTPNPQPITTKPEMTLVDGERVIYVGTGRYIGLTDLPDTNVQSFYGIKDTLGGDNITAGGGQVTWNPRDDTVTPIGNLFIQRKLISTTDSGAQITTTDAVGNTVSARKICTGASSSVDNSTGNCVGEPTSPTEMDWETYGGWYFDFSDSGERMNVDMNLTFGTLSIPSNVPASSACTTGGYGYLNFIDFKTGLSVVGEDTVSLKISNSLIVGINALYVNGKLVVDAITSSGSGINLKAPGDKNKFLGVRDLWRELNPY